MYVEYLHMAKHIMQIPHCIPFCLLVQDLDLGWCCERLSAQDSGLSRWLTAARCGIYVCVCVYICMCCSWMLLPACSVALPIIGKETQSSCNIWLLFIFALNSQMLAQNVSVGSSPIPPPPASLAHF